MPDRNRAVRLREIERWIAWIRLGAIPFTVLQILLTDAYPRGYELRAWIAGAVLTVGAVLFFVLSRRDLSARAQERLSALALIFDAGIVSLFVLVFHFERGTPIRQLLFLPLVEAALRYGFIGAIGFALASTPVVAGFESLRANRFHNPYELNFVTFQIGVEVIMGLIVAWLVERLRGQTAVADSRAREAELLRDELGRRVDVLEAANRCARALGSSLELDEAFQAFVRELQGLVPFARMSIVLVEGGVAEVMFVAGEGAETTFPAGSARPVAGSVLEEILGGRTVLRDDMQATQYPEEAQLLALGLRSRLATPLLVGARAIGMLAVVRREPHAFSAEDVELVSLLGRLVGTAVQNIRAYEAEHETAEELRRLSALRADFVSLVSHELRSPMAAVIGSARTLQERWRVLTPDQRESFLALIAGETARLATLIGDVLDTSRIEAGTFSYTFDDLDVAELVRETVAAAQVGQDEVQITAEVEAPLPAIRGDRERLRQVLTNLIDNAVKYSPVGGEVTVSAVALNGSVRIDVADRGPGIPREQQKMIFEKFGRASSGGAAKPGTGLGLFIARSIAEAHGGALDVRSTPDRGATFTLALPPNADSNT
jgi:signal transduction histidine kinase